MKSIGKIGKRNINANKQLKKIFEEKDIRYCEMRLDGCLIVNYLQFCHKHKREWYRKKGRQELLYDFRQVILGCQNCHDKIEKDRELTAKIFNNLRNE